MMLRYFNMSYYWFLMFFNIFYEDYDDPLALVTIFHIIKLCLNKYRELYCIPNQMI